MEISLLATFDKIGSLAATFKIRKKSNFDRNQLKPSTQYKTYIHVLIIISFTSKY